MPIRLLIWTGEWIAIAERSGARGAWSRPLVIYAPAVGRADKSGHPSLIQARTSSARHRLAFPIFMGRGILAVLAKRQTERSLKPS
jgi:hypothetical protein